MTPSSPKVGTFCTHLHAGGGIGRLVRFYHQQQRLPLGRRWDYYLSAQNDEGPRGRILEPSKVILAGPTRDNEPF